jgi:hypothetical protein
VSSQSQVKDTKAWKKYSEAKALIKANPELSWLGDEEGLFFDQKVRSLNMLCTSLDLDIDLRQAMFIQTTQKFTHEDNLLIFGKEELDTISKLSVKGADDKPRKQVEEEKEEKEEKEQKEENGIRGGKVE